MQQKVYKGICIVLIFGLLTIAKDLFELIDDHQDIGLRWQMGFAHRVHQAQRTPSQGGQQKGGSPAIAAPLFPEGRIRDEFGGQSFEG